MTRWRALALTLAGALAWGGVSAQVGPAGLTRGQALYEARCDRCHDRSVHARDKRAAKSFAEVRAQVVRWDRALGALWRSDEIDVVTRYLNHRYYQYPCPREICGTEGADLRPPGMPVSAVSPAPSGGPTTVAAAATAR
ncbi:MAG: hypothetical protein E6Q93_28755 [Burkholderiaceae bacterium]|nr:MAG: hypothetical protein E6Q93_28755 [Burkholderiaceae bacterium]